MWILLLPLLAQVPVERPVLEAEHAREAGAAALVRATTTGPVRARALAARGLGRLENPAHAPALVPLLSSPSPLVRAAAAGAFAQMKVARDWAPQLSTERDATVRAAIYEAAGRGAPVSENAEALLVAGLRDADVRARTGAARGIESLVRLNRRTLKLTTTSLAALRGAFLQNPTEEFRELVLLALNGSRDEDAATLTAGLADPSPLVRRLAVTGAKRFVRDTSALVRVEAYRFETDCGALAAALNDPDDHVAINAGAYMKERGCPSAPLLTVASSDRNWRRRGNALQTIGVHDTIAARPLVPILARDPVWQVRAYAATAARSMHDSVTLQLLARDSNPNVAAAAVSTVDDAVRAIRSDHAGLILSGARRLSAAPDLPARLPRIVGAFNRLTGDGSMTVRDPRVALLQLIGQVPDTTTNALLRDALYDRDPAVAALAAKILSQRTGTTVVPETKALPIPPIPPASYIAALSGARVRITMRGLGTMTLDLLTEEAPVTVGVFAQLAEAGQYTGLTFHRIVSNFVVQGGSPGADEYDGRTREFMRDELGFARNARGTIGISTRGRDTGDGQLYFNLVDNVRLDRDYTVMARMVSGFDVMDRIQEGDVIERIEILRRAR